MSSSTPRETVTLISDGRDRSGTRWTYENNADVTFEVLRDAETASDSPDRAMIIGLLRDQRSRRLAENDVDPHGIVWNEAWYVGKLDNLYRALTENRGMRKLPW